MPNERCHVTYIGVPLSLEMPGYPGVPYGYVVLKDTCRPHDLGMLHDLKVTLVTQ